MDFAKAFDSVPHFRLLVKLNSLGIGTDVLAWIKAFLPNRKQRVVIEGVSSPWTNVISGIPQGSLQGPTLFVVFINDMPSYISSFCKLFPLDAKIYRAVNCTDDERSLKHILTIWKNGLKRGNYPTARKNANAYTFEKQTSNMNILWEIKSWKLWQRIKIS